MKKYVIYYTVDYRWDDDGYGYLYPKDDSSSEFDDFNKALEEFGYCKKEKIDMLERTGDSVTVTLTRVIFPLDEKDEPVEGQTEYEDIDCQTITKTENGYLYK